MEFNIDAAFEAAISRWEKGEQRVIAAPTGSTTPGLLRDRVLRGWQVPTLEEIGMDTSENKAVEPVVFTTPTNRPSELKSEQIWATRLE